MFIGERILISGAAGGLGFALSEALLDAGANVIGLVKTKTDAATFQQKLEHPNLRVLVADLGDTDMLTDALSAEIFKNGPIYGVVNNAAIYPKSPATDLEPEEFAGVLAVNAVAAATVVKTCLPAMKTLGAGRLVNITSNTFDTGMVGLGAYVASKGALVGLSRVWARELGAFGITSNAVAPGAFRTDAEKIHPNPEEYDAIVLEQQSVKRRGEPSEFASLVTYLLGPNAGFISGQTIRIDGGWVTQ